MNNKMVDKEKIMVKDFECAEHLQGKTLNGKWTVTEKMEKESGETGGNFSIGYIVKGINEEKAFLKAIDGSVAQTV